MMCAASAVSVTIAHAQTATPPKAPEAVPQAAPQAVAPAAPAAVVSQEQAVRERFIERFGNMPVNNVRQTPFGLFEVQLGNSLIYTDEQVRFVLDGHLIEAETRKDLTQERLDELAKVDFEKLPFELAFTQVRGNGSRRVAIFEDPNCGYCKVLRKNMEGIDNLTIYTFMLPILSSDSTEKVRNIWCAKDRGATWDDWMLRGKVPPEIKCDAPIPAMLEAGKQLMVQGTPAIFFVDGTRVPGAISKQELLERLK